MASQVFKRGAVTPQMNITPLIDVVFLLIIFFMVGTKFTELERNLHLKVPEVSDNGALSPAPQKRVVNVYQDGQISLDREIVTLEQLINRLAAARSQYQDLGVLVRGDGTGQFQRVAEVLNACKQAGVAELGISLRVANRER